MEIEVIMTKTGKTQIMRLVPNSHKLCSCGREMYFGEYYSEHKGVVRPPIVQVIKEKLSFEDIGKENNMVWICHFLDCPHWQKYKTKKP